MARDGATTPHALWADPAFLGLTQAQQRVFLFAKSQPQVSYAGVVAYTSRRWATMAADSTAPKMRRDLEAVQAAGFLVVDEQAEEVLIRNFVVHERVLLQPNVAKATLKAFAAIHSALLRAVFLLDLHVLNTGVALPGWEKGWGVLSDLLGEPLPDPLPKGFPKPFAKALPKPLAEVSSRARASASARPVLDLDPEEPCTYPTSTPTGGEPLAGCSKHTAAADGGCRACRRAILQAATPPPPPVEPCCTPLPGEVERLRSKLDARRMRARWDQLTEAELDEIINLVGVHGDERLLSAAIGAYRADDPPAFAQAWLGHWRALAPPGELRVITQRCSVHLLNTPCRGCAADRKAAVVEA